MQRCFSFIFVVLLLFSGANFSVPQTLAQEKIATTTTLAAASPPASTPAPPDAAQALLKVLEDPAARDSLIKILKNQPTTTTPAPPTLLTEPVIEPISEYLVEDSISDLANWLRIEGKRWKNYRNNLDKWWNSNSANIGNTILLALAPALGAIALTLLLLPIAGRFNAKKPSLPRLISSHLLIIIMAAISGFTVMLCLGEEHGSKSAGLLLQAVLWFCCARLLLQAFHQRLQSLLGDQIAPCRSQTLLSILALTLLAGFGRLILLGAGWPMGLVQLMASFLLIISCGWFSHWLWKYRSDIEKSLFVIFPIAERHQACYRLIRLCVPLLFTYALLLVFLWVSDSGKNTELVLHLAVGGAVGVCILYLLWRVLRRGNRFILSLFVNNPLQPAISFILTALQIAISLLVLTAFLSVMGVPVLRWLQTALIEKMVGVAISGLIIVSLAFFLQYLLKTTIITMLKKAENRGDAARLRTLLPMLHNAGTIILWLLAGLMICGELGINVGPILAGAGVVGLAVGFGAQTLVKDIITGIFMLLENTLTVGDVVTVGNHSGVVEAFSIRTLQLRDIEGRLHTVPFSAVSTVINFTRSFSYAVVDLPLDLRHDPLEVEALLHRAASRLEKDEAIKDQFFLPLEIPGLQKFDGEGMSLRCRIKTKAGKQWAVKALFLRHIRAVMAEEGITMPVSKLYLLENKPAE
ncbi:MAG: mechanosensitive ion channel family protein [Alphaproteobacteria bacterium]